MENNSSTSDQFVIRLNYDTTGTIVQLPLDMHNSVSQLAKNADQALGIDLHCYNNDDYLFLRAMLHHAEKAFHKMSCDPNTGAWIEGCQEVPQIVLSLIEQPAVATDENDRPILGEDGMYIPDDRKLNAGISGPHYQSDKPYYVFKFNRYMLQRFTIFLQEVFDKNEELVMSFHNANIRLGDGHSGTTADIFTQSEYVSKDSLFAKVQDLYRAGLYDLGYSLMVQVAHMSDDECIPEPHITFWDNPATGETKLLGFSYADHNRKVFYIPIRKRIYNTSGFFNYFIRRNTLISELFVEAIRMIVYHEFFHIANGHGLLKNADPSYVAQKDVSVCAEQNADDAAMRMMICELLFDTLDGNPGSAQLKYSRKELIHTWAIRIFAGYLALSWMHRGDDRTWDEETLEKYIDNPELTHPLYQFRTFNIINCAFNRLLDIERCQEMRLITSEGLPIDKSVIHAAIATAKDFLYSFEASFRMTYDDTRSMEEKIMQSWKVERKSIPKIPQEVPFLMTSLSERAAEEAAKIRATWPELQKRLADVGAYNLRFSKI